jgi:hypothetical protein
MLPYGTGEFVQQRNKFNYDNYLGGRDPKYWKMRDDE